MFQRRFPSEASARAKKTLRRPTSRRPRQGDRLQPRDPGPSTPAIASATTGSVSARLTQNRRVISASSGLACEPAAGVRGSSAIHRAGSRPAERADLRVHRAGPAASPARSPPRRLRRRRPGRCPDTPPAPPRTASGSPRSKRSRSARRSWRARAAAGGHRHAADGILFGLSRDHRQTTVRGGANRSGCARLQGSALRQKR